MIGPNSPMRDKANNPSTIDEMNAQRVWDKVVVDQLYVLVQYWQLNIFISLRLMVAC